MACGENENECENNPYGGSGIARIRRTARLA